MLIFGGVQGHLVAGHAKPLQAAMLRNFRFSPLKGISVELILSQCILSRQPVFSSALFSEHESSREHA